MISISANMCTCLSEAFWDPSQAYLRRYHPSGKYDWGSEDVDISNRQWVYEGTEMTIRIFDKCKNIKVTTAGLFAGIFWNSWHCSCSLLALVLALPNHQRLTFINWLLIAHTVALSAKSLTFILQIQLTVVFVLFVSALGSAAAAGLATRRQAGGGHMLLPSERSGNKCATNGGPSTPPSSSFSSSWRQGINSSWWM